jgi:PleD family two-component response regulator
MADVKSKILVVEDDLDVAEMLNAYFRVQGYEVFTVNWGEDGIRASQTVDPDLVVLDIRLPDIDGYEVARRLRTDRRTQDVPIIFLTEKRDRDDRLHGLELGADDYITKPFDIQELRLRVRNALQRATQGSLNNPVSELPDGALVDEKFDELLEKGKWSLILVSIINLDIFRDAYGFVASDDVLRAISLMIKNAMRESGNAEEFVGHLTPTDFVLVVSSGNLSALQQLIRKRLEQSLDYFYPIKDRDQVAKSENRLGIKVVEVPASRGRFKDVDMLKKELLRLIR